MRARVYRNLDTPFEIYGFSPYELIILVLLFVVGGELAQFAGISRVPVFILAGMAALAMFSFRRSMGPRFLLRLLRFVRLPKDQPPALLNLSRLS